MSDRRKSTRPEPARPVTVNVPPELQPRCRVKVGATRCTRPAGHEGDHRTEPPAPDQPGGMPDIVSGYRAGDVTLRATYRVQVSECDARRLEQLAEEQEAIPVPYLRFIQAAAVDLMNVAAFLDFYADDGGDGVQRHEIPVAALVMEVAPEVERIAERLMEAVSAAKEAGE